MAEKEKNLLMKAYSKKTFLKIKQELDFGEGKVVFSFVDQNNVSDHIDIYMDAVEFATDIARECSLVTNERLFKKLIAEKEKGESYPAAVYTSPMGGNATGNNGKPICRYFEISPASSVGDVLFTAKVFPAIKSETGAYIAEKGAKALMTLRVPCSYRDLRGMALRWEYLEKDFFSRKFTAENMKSDYTRNNADEDSAVCIPDTGNVQNVETSDVPNSDSSVNKTKVISEKLTAYDNIVELKPGLKACRVKKANSDQPLRMIIMLDKVDAKRFDEFENALKQQLSKNKTLSFTANVAEKGNDIYLRDFA